VSPAGEITEMAVADWVALPIRGDASVDAGNAFCKDDIRRAQRMTFLAIDDSDKDVIGRARARKSCRQVALRVA
jgi:6-phosphogluconate dehydrogenase (decarboxylating)